jgi:hypothetical protein
MNHIIVMLAFSGLTKLMGFVPLRSQNKAPFLQPPQGLQWWRKASSWRIASELE